MSTDASPRDKKGPQANGAKRRPPDHAAPKPVRGAKLALFWLLLIVVFPGLILLIAEMGLRLVGYGIDTGYFKKVRVASEAFYVPNCRYFEQFMGGDLARSPDLCRVPAEKGDNVYRIFVLGASAARGEPDDAFGMGRYLEAMLEAEFPQDSFEMHMVACAAINSHVVRRIARECARLEPDLFVVYLGNNEVIGPYGSGTVFQSRAQSLASIRFAMAAQSLRLVQFAQNLGARLQNTRQVHRDWQGLEMFAQNQVAANDPRLGHIYDFFEANLGDIVKAGTEAGARVLVSSVASNLKDYPPCGSQHRQGMSAEEAAEWEAVVEAGAAHVDAGELDAAVAAFRKALELDDEYARLHYRLGRALLLQGETDDARRAFIRARDLDTLRFRADTIINERIARIAGQYAERGATFVDGDAAVAAASPHGIPGEELLYEHVHYRTEGNYVMARALFDALMPHLPERLQARAEGAGGTPTYDICSERLALTEWNLYEHTSRMLGMVSRPPFTGQLDSDVREQRFRKRLAELARFKSPQTLSHIGARYAAALKRMPNDPHLHRHYARLLNELGDRGRAVEQARWVCANYPTYLKGRSELGDILWQSGQPDKAIAAYEEVLAMRPSVLDAKLTIARCMEDKGDLTGALKRYQACTRIPGLAEEAYVRLGLALSHIGRPNPAERAFREAIALKPSLAAAYDGLDKVLAARLSPAEAADEWRALAEAYKEAPYGYLHLGNILSAMRDVEGAVAAYRQASGIDPRSTAPYLALASLYASQGALPEAINEQNQAIALDPYDYDLRVRLGDYLGAAGRTHEAVAALRSAIDVNPHRLPALKMLDVMLRGANDTAERVRVWRELARAHSDALFPPFALGAALEDAGDVAGARAAYEDCLRINPRFTPAQQALGRLGSMSAG